MRQKNHLKSALQQLFAKLMATPEERWVIITRTMGKNGGGQRWLLEEILKMTEVMGMQVSFTDETEYKIMRGVDPTAWMPFSYRMGQKQLPKSFRVTSNVFKTNDITYRGLAHKFAEMMNTPTRRNP